MAYALGAMQLPSLLFSPSRRSCRAASLLEKKHTILPVPVTAMDGKKTIPAAVRRAGEWALVNASFHALSFAMRPAVAYALAQHDATCSECVAPTDAQSALWLGMLWCAALQAAAAALALLLPCRHRRALAHLALAVTSAGHCMYAVTVGLLLAGDPGFLFGRIVGPATIVFFAGGDLVCFLSLLQLSWEVRTE